MSTLLASPNGGSVVLGLSNGQGFILSTTNTIINQGTGSIVATPLRLTFAESGTTITTSGMVQPVFLDQSAGAGTYSMPVSPPDGQTLICVDTGNVTVGQGGSWLNYAPTFAVVGGTLIQDPNASGTYSATSVSAIAQNGGVVIFQYGATENAWFVVG